MKHLFFILLFSVSQIISAQDFSFLEEGNEVEVEEETNTYTSNWLTNLEEAQTIAKATNKPILVYFTGSDWCAPCKELKADFFESQEFQKYTDDFVLVLIDYPRRIDILPESQMVYNKKVITKYNKSKTFPKIILLDKNLREKDKISGYSSLKDTSHHFNFIKKYAQGTK